MREYVKPIQQKLRKFQPSLEPQIKPELKKLLEAKIIFEVRHYAWVSNLVSARKKNGEIRLCVDILIKLPKKIIIIYHKWNKFYN